MGYGSLRVRVGSILVGWQSKDQASVIWYLAKCGHSSRDGREKRESKLNLIVRRCLNFRTNSLLRSEGRKAFEGSTGMYSATVLTVPR